MLLWWSSLMCFYTSFPPTLSSCQGGVKCSAVMGSFLLHLLAQLSFCIQTYAAAIKQQAGVPVITWLLHCCSTISWPSGEAHIVQSCSKWRRSVSFGEVSHLQYVGQVWTYLSMLSSNALNIASAFLPQPLEWRNDPTATLKMCYSHYHHIHYVRCMWRGYFWMPKCQIPVQKKQIFITFFHSVKKSCQNPASFLLKAF